MIRLCSMHVTVLLLATICPVVYGNTTYNVAINTQPLVGHPAGPFYLYLELSAGGWTGHATNTVTLSNITFGGGSSLGSPALSGGATGSLTGGVTISDSSFQSVFSEQFAPGLQLSFTLNLNSNEGIDGIPDRFVLFILDNSGSPLPTLSPVANYILGCDLYSSTPNFDAYTSDPSRAPSTGNPISMTAPSILSPSATAIASLTSTTANINVFGYGFTVPSGQLSLTDTTSSTPITSPVTLNTSAATTSLLPQVVTGTGEDTLPDWTTLGDLNGDGNLDLVTSLFLTDSVSVQLGNGDGTFQPAKQILIAPGFGPAESHLVSLRGTGTLDLIVGSFNTNEIAILLGKGDGTFQSPVFYTVGSDKSTPTSLTTGDFNLDGNLDVAAANTGDDTVSILFGNGSGSLTQSGSTISVGRDPEAIRAGDFNGDGYPDLAVANYADGTITTLLNNQGGTFTPTVISVGNGAGSGPQALAITGSGNTLLLAVANYKNNSISVLLSNGDGTFRAQKIIPVGKGPDDINFADFNGDSIPDLAVSHYSSDSVSLVMGSSTGSYSVLGPFSVGTGPYSAAVGDLDQDGTPDLVVSNCFSNETGVLLSGTQIAVPFSGISFPPGATLQASYAPDSSSRYEPSTSSGATASLKTGVNRHSVRATK